CIFAVWHARVLPLAWTHRGRGIVVLVSRHRDGQLIARIIERLGFATSRGSSTRGGEEGVMDMLRQAEGGRLIGITPDGPRGPAESLKPGLVYLASRSGLPIVPIATASRRCWRLRSWDRFRVPRPFTRVLVAYGEPIPVPPGIEGETLEAWRARVESALAALGARAPGLARTHRFAAGGGELLRRRCAAPGPDRRDRALAPLAAAGAALRCAGRDRERAARRTLRAKLQPARARALLAGRGIVGRALPGRRGRAALARARRPGRAHRSRRQSQERRAPAARTQREGGARRPRPRARSPAARIGQPAARRGPPPRARLA